MKQRKQPYPVRMNLQVTQAMRDDLEHARRPYETMAQVVRAAIRAELLSRGVREAEEPS